MVGSVFCPLLNTDSLSDAFRYLNWMQAGASEVRDHMLLAQALFKTQLKANTIPPIRDILCFSIRTKYLEGSRPMRVQCTTLVVNLESCFPGWRQSTSCSTLWLESSGNVTIWLLRGTFSTSSWNGKRSGIHCPRSRLFSDWLSCEFMVLLKATPQTWSRTSLYQKYSEAHQEHFILNYCNT